MKKPASQIVRAECQVCCKMIGTRNGKIAAHGYNNFPGSSHTGCPGANHSPAPAYDALEELAADMDRAAAAYEADGKSMKAYDARVSAEQARKQVAEIKATAAKPVA